MLKAKISFTKKDGFTSTFYLYETGYKTARHPNLISYQEEGIKNWEKKFNDIKVNLNIISNELKEIRIIQHIPVIVK